MFEKVYTYDWYDGPRRGVADYRSQPHLFESEWRDSGETDHEDTFLLVPIDPNSFAHVLEVWAILGRWETSVHRGEDTRVTHPALPADRERHEELKKLLDGRLKVDPVQAVRKAAEFQVCQDPTWSGYGWSPAGSAVARPSMTFPSGEMWPLLSCSKVLPCEADVTTVQFGRGDVWVLWCIPNMGCNLESLIHTYTFVARDAIPSYASLAGCLTRAVRAGLMSVPTGGRYILNPEWYARIHFLDEQFQAPEYGLGEFEDEFVVRDWPAADDADFVLGTDEYQRAQASFSGTWTIYLESSNAMGHHIRGFIASEESLRWAASSLPGARVVPLRLGFGFLPVTEELTGDDERFPFAHLERLTTSLGTWAEEQSRLFPLAYIETDYFGGTGGKGRDHLGRWPGRVGPRSHAGPSRGWQVRSYSPP